MENAEMQEEEKGALEAIYDGDECFSIEDGLYKYRFGNEGDNRSFILSISWPEDYPSVEPNVRMDSFYNYHILPAVKKRIVADVRQQAADLLDTSMTFTLIEYVRENLDTLLEGQPEQYGGEKMKSQEAEKSTEVPDNVQNVKVKKEQLSKAQKRRLFDRFGASGEKERGWNWVNVVHHLHQTGTQS